MACPSGASPRPADACAIAEQVAPRAGDRYPGRCIGWDTIDNWGWVELTFAPGQRVLVSLSDIRDGQPLRAGDRITCRVEQGKVGSVAREVERR